MDWDSDIDRYRDITKVINEVLNEEDFPRGDIERLEITCLANGEATWRVWAARADDPVGGTYLNSDMPYEDPAPSR